MNVKAAAIAFLCGAVLGACSGPQVNTPEPLRTGIDSDFGRKTPRPLPHKTPKPRYSIPVQTLRPTVNPRIGKLPTARARTDWGSRSGKWFKRRK